MATYNIRNIHPVYSRRDERFDTREIAAGVTFTKGAPLTIDADGRWIIAGAANINGIATADSDDYDWQNDTFNQVNPTVPAADHAQEFRGTLLGTYAATDNSEAYPLGTTTVNGETIYVVDKAGLGADQVQILGIEDGVQVGDVNVPVRFVILPAARGY